MIGVSNPIYQDNVYLKAYVKNRGVINYKLSRILVYTRNGHMV